MASSFSQALSFLRKEASNRLPESFYKPPVFFYRASMMAIYRDHGSEAVRRVERNCTDPSLVVTLNIMEIYGGPPPKNVGVLKTYEPDSWDKAFFERSIQGKPAS